MSVVTTQKLLENEINIFSPKIFKLKHKKYLLKLKWFVFILIIHRANHAFNNLVLPHATTKLT